MKTNTAATQCVPSYIQWKEGRERKIPCLLFTWCWVIAEWEIKKECLTNSKEPEFQAFRWVFLIFIHDVLHIRKSNSWRKRNLETVMETAAQAWRKIWISAMSGVGSASSISSANLHLKLWKVWQRLKNKWEQQLWWLEFSQSRLSISNL